MLEMQFAFMTSTTPTVAEVSCSSSSCEPSLIVCNQSCIDTIKRLREDIESLIKELDDEKFLARVFRLKQKPPQDKYDAKCSDFAKVQDDWSNVSMHLLFAKTEMTGATSVILPSAVI